jgi:branched-chain amino acid transport system permease protein
MRRLGPSLPPAVVVVLLAVFPVVLPGELSWIGLGFLSFIFVTLAVAWNLVGGYAGQISFGHAVFFGAGAYTSTLLLLHFAVSPWLGMLAGALVAIALALVIGIPTFRLAGHYFAIATIVVAEIIATAMTSADAVGGARGLFPPILPSGIGNLQFHETRVPYYFVALALYIVAVLITWAVERHRVGYYLRAIREDEQAAKSVGVSVLTYKLVAASLSATLTALCGSVYAQYILFIDPESVFPLSLSIRIALVPILGGVGHWYGPLLGALVLVPLQELTRFQFGGTGRGADLIVYGGIVLISVLQPGGLAALGGTLRRARLRWQTGSAA